MPNSERLAAAHGQNRSRGLPLRSDSAIVLMPFCSITDFSEFSAAVTTRTLDPPVADGQRRAATLEGVTEAATHWILTLVCEDKPGIVHAISGAIVEADGNIT